MKLTRLAGHEDWSGHAVALQEQATPLHIAAKLGHKEAVDLLLFSEMPLIITATNYQFSRLLRLAQLEVRGCVGWRSSQDSGTSTASLWYRTTCKPSHTQH